MDAELKLAYDSLRAAINSNSPLVQIEPLAPCTWRLNTATTPRSQVVDKAVPAGSRLVVGSGPIGAWFLAPPAENRFRNHDEIYNLLYDCRHA